MKKGDTVTWSWGNGRADGEVQEVRTDRTTIESHGSEVTRNGSDDNPAVLIRQEDGTKVLKLASELDGG